MRRIDNYQNTREIKFHIDVPFIMPPKIARTKIIDGEIFYVGTNKKLYRADLYDKMFTTTKSSIKPYNFKGAKYDETFNLFDDEKPTVDAFNKKRRKKTPTQKATPKYRRYYKLQNR